MVCLKNYFWLISTAAVLFFGLILWYSYGLSHAAAWSILVSGTNYSAWEMAKPFYIIDIFWVFIELSYLRPSLLHYLSARILSLHVLIFLSLTAGVFYLNGTREITPFYFFIIFIILIISHGLSHILNRSIIKWELFFVPIFISFLIIFFMILFLSLFPPHNIFFYDFYSQNYGKYDYDFIQNNLSCIYISGVL